jgi:hypothetical protein
MSFNMFFVRQSPPSALQTMDLKVADLRKILNKLLFKSERKVIKQYNKASLFSKMH